MKTVEQWFNLLKQPYKKKALNNTPKEHLNTEDETFSDALMSAFDWSTSPEGTDYWVNVNKYLSKNLTNP